MHWLTEYWWFDAAGYARIFRLKLGFQVLCAVGSLLAYAGILLLNYWLALRLTRDRPFYAPKNSDWTPFMPGLTIYGGMAFILLLALGAAQRGAKAWETVLKFLNPTDFGSIEPIYQQDNGYNVFRLPVYQGLQQQGLELLIWC